MGAYISGPRPLGRINTVCSHLKHVLKQTFRPKHAKKQCAIFGKKLQKNMVLVRTGLGSALTLCSNLKTGFTKNLDQNMLENALFFEKNWKKAMHPAFN